jgi:two-component system, chemotaxis family, chemotaxis protein CheV
MSRSSTNDSKQILQVGSNLFELIEFTLSKDSKPILFAVNVAKVREVIRMPALAPCVSHSAGVLGVFSLRGSPVPVIHLAKILGLPSVKENEVVSGQVIVTEFTGKMAGFVVESARRIRRVGWDKVLPPLSETFKWATGMMVLEPNDFIFILDFEKVLQEVEGIQNYPVQAWNQVSMSTHSNSSSQTIYVVDDSSTARRAVCEMLKPLGYTILEFPNGPSVLEHLHQIPPNKNSLMISDVEMPQLDGYSLVMRIHSEEGLEKFPIILHSSLTGEINVERARQCGAVSYVSKFNKREIVDSVARIFSQIESGDIVSSQLLKKNKVA